MSNNVTALMAPALAQNLAQTVGLTKYNSRPEMAVQIDRLTAMLTVAQYATLCRENGVQPGQRLKLTVELFNDPDNHGAPGLCLRAVGSDVRGIAERSSPAVASDLPDSHGFHMVQFTSNQAPFIRLIQPAFARVNVPARLSHKGALIVALPDESQRAAPVHRHRRAKVAETSQAHTAQLEAGTTGGLPKPGALSLDEALAAANRNGMRLVVGASGSYTFVPPSR